MPGQEHFSRTGMPGHRPAWRTVIITPAERLGRIAISVAAIVAGVVMLTGVGAALAMTLELLLLGHCLLYAKLGYTPRSLRRTR